MAEQTFHIITFGCQMNVNDSSWLGRALEQRGFIETGLDEANVVILNTCSVRDKPEQKVYHALSRIAHGMKDRPQAFTVVAGCVAQQIGEDFLTRFDRVRLVVGSDGLIQAPDAILRLWNDPAARLHLIEFTPTYPERDAVLRPLSPESRVSSDAVAALTATPLADSFEASAFVNIMQGCDNFCAYCIVPYTRGRQKSRQPDAILEECQNLLDRGVREITLLGQNVNAYGLDGGNGTSKQSFAYLLRRVAALPGLARLRFVTPHPKDFSSDVVALFGELENLCPRLHLPLQAGSDTILKAMGRKYTRTRFMELAESLRVARPGLALSTDIIVGFPGETEEDFLDTLEAMKQARFMSSFSFCYSDRPGTRAANMPDKIPLAVKKERLVRLQALQDELAAEWLSGKVGVHTELLLETPSRKPGSESAEPPKSWQGRDPWGNTVNLAVPDGRPGLVVPAIITAAKRHSLTGRLLGPVNENLQTF